MTTGFFWDERCFWHTGHGYALTAPISPTVQPLPDGFPDSPETKRRMKNLMDVSGLTQGLHCTSADPATWEDLLRVHPDYYLRDFKEASDAEGGELGPRAPFSKGGFEIAALSAGLVTAALGSVLKGQNANAYALSRPPGHHCLPDTPNGFCLLSNICIAIEAARAAGLAERFAVVDWDVHHGNGTEAIFYDRADVLTVSIHQDRNYPMDTGAPHDRGDGPGLGLNLNVPLPPGTGHRGYLSAWDRLVQPALAAFKPDVVIIACGFDAAAFDPLGRMMATAETFGELTQRAMTAAAELCGGRLVMAHEGGYSEVYVPFCGHRVLEVMSGSALNVADPLAETLRARQPDAVFDAMVDAHLDRIAEMIS